jgi:urocanate hydratase
MVTRIGDGESGIDPTANQYPEPRQIAVYRKYLLLQSLAGMHFQGSLAGKLIACPGFGLNGSEWAIATMIAGGAFLGMEPDPQRLKAAVRNASCNFMVNTQDEALRVLKNEVRKGKAVSIGLLGPVADILAAMVERGVQPDMFAESMTGEIPDAAKIEEHHALQQLVARGTIAISANESAESVANNSAHLEIVWSAGALADMRRLDQSALGWLPQRDILRRRWLEQAGGFFYRQLPLERILALQCDELTSLLDALRHGGNLLAPANVRWRDPDGTLHTAAL